MTEDRGAAETAAGRALRGALTVLGTIAVVAGLYAVATGVNGMPGENSADPSVDSELRFFGAFYVGFGAVALWLAPRAASETRLLRAWALVLFVAGLARAVSWLDVGRPQGLFVALMIAELVIAPIVVVWQARIRVSAGQVTD